MSGVLFVVCIPTWKQEMKVRKNRASETNFLVDESKSTSEENIKKSRSSDNMPVFFANIEDCEIMRRSRSEDVFLDAESKSVSASSSRSLLNDDGTNASDKTTTSMNLPARPEGTMEKVLDVLLKGLKIDNAVWCIGKSNNFYQVLFSVGSSDIIEETLRQLHDCGIGTKSNSVVSVIPCSLYYEGVEHLPCEDEDSDDRSKKDPASVSAWDKFVLSVRARLTVAQVVERVKSDACLTFDFLVLLLIAGVVAALGLIENSTIILVASMLISPLMGPIMAGTFGTVIEDRRLQKMGVLNELFGLFICVLVGFVFGLAVGTIEDSWGRGPLPTEEMMFRGQIRSLWVGLLIALPSGAAVAIALLGDNTGSLVGVAISASLLPPAVNAGLLWSLACVRLMSQDASSTSEMPLNASLPLPANGTQTEPTFIYSQDVAVELAILGAISLCLTLVNIICIFLTGILVLKVKEVSPRTSGKESQFWHHDIKIARDYNKTLNKEDGKQLQKQLADELAGFADVEFTAPDPGRKYFHVSPERISSIPQRFLPRHQQTWSPTRDDTRLSLQELESLYASLTGSTLPLSPGKRRTSPWLPVPDSSSAIVPGWLRSHMSPPSHVTHTETGLPTIRESKRIPILAPPSSARRVVLPSMDVRQYPANRKRFVVSPVEEDPNSPAKH